MSKPKRKNYVVTVREIVEYGVHVRAKNEGEAARLAMEAVVQGEVDDMGVQERYVDMVLPGKPRRRAKDAHSYRLAGIAEARALLAAGKMQPEGYPLIDSNGKALNVSMNGSWQARAWRGGFDSERNKPLTPRVQPC